MPQEAKHRQICCALAAEIIAGELGRLARAAGHLFRWTGNADPRLGAEARLGGESEIGEVLDFAGICELVIAKLLTW
jgi:hypothetical protein